MPLSLHVDYWNHIGWEDPFSRPLFTQRQRWLSDLAASRTVYTPEVFVGGRELRNWRGETAAMLRRINAQPARASIEITLGSVAGHHVPVAVKANSPLPANLSLYVALYENKLSSDVSRGENSGVRLHHDRVVREWIGPVALTRGSAAVTKVLDLPLSSRPDQMGVAAFVQSDQGEVLQALALPACS
ncbi:hypothetical protein GCM10022212_32040 [Actimicrobium antarcticum]|uniref:DUF1223 domain-containing protein n=1 Tax=Actimicrobium antarcticum TaxID=1051899 RepID=A0ABP7TU97_9BURK